MTESESSSRVHPDSVLQGLLARTRRSDKKQNLVSVHEVCRTQHSTGSRDFSVSTIGKLVEVAGVLKAAVLKTKQSSDYRELIVAWAFYAGPPERAKAPKAVHKGIAPEWLMKIEDPAARSHVQSVIIERDRLRQQVNTLKANANVTIDMRPQATPQHEPAVTLVAPTTLLNESERIALEEAVSSLFLAGEGWREGPRGEVLNESGRKIYRPGYLSGLRKLTGKS